MQSPATLASTYDVQLVVDAVFVGLFKRVERRVVVHRRLERRVVVIRQQVHPVQVSGKGSKIKVNFSIYYRLSKYFLCSVKTLGKLIKNCSFIVLSHHVATAKPTVNRN